ncbi:dynein axonemal heavy chain 2-like [Mercenaria mercenaria]|uniref:dynein axonemal heavy chain 2-like n=1 Tax=Mercenaria mercenaria TaxID=6596 RepID=UPI00234EE88D|nr:dynein axonemal heavy chain 2-like [Mercenaria mercenaria]XP_053398718.1 dynein axonemal heavy chain 2-like [Mercenaria mercenaria]
MEGSGKPVEHDRRMSIISQASMAVSQLPKENLQEIKSYAKPPEAVKEVLSAAMLLLGHQESEVNWKMVQKCLAKLGEDSLQQRVADMDLEKIPQKNTEKAKAILSKYDADKIAKISLAVKAIYVWVDAVTEY